MKITVDSESSKGSSTEVIQADILPYALEKLSAQLFRESPGQGRDIATLILPSITCA